MWDHRRLTSLVTNQTAPARVPTALIDYYLELLGVGRHK